MKIKIFALILSLIIISLSVIACVEIPLGPSESVGGVSESGAMSAVTGVSEPDDSSEEPSLPSIIESSTEPSSVPDVSDERSEPASEESSSEPVSEGEASYVVPEDYPYQNIADLDSYEIKPDDLDEYFRDSVFIGNSIMVHFKNYVTARRASDANFLGKCKILARSAYSPFIEFEKDPKTDYMISYQGEHMHVWDAVKATGAKTAYISLMALNELGLHPNATCAEDTFNNTVKIIEKIKEVNPGITIVILSNTYMVNTFNYKNLNNTNIYKLNCLALDYCNQNGIAFLDVSSPLTADGYLKYSYCIDPDPKTGNGCHLQQKCYKAWTAILRNYAYAMQNGGHKNIETMPKP